MARASCEIKCTAQATTFTAPTVAANTNLTFQVSVGGANSTTPATATVTVPIAPPAPPQPSVSATSNPASPVASGAAVTLSASGVDPAGGTLTYTWTAPGGVTLTPVAGTNGAQQTFTAPTVPPLSAPSTLSFTVTAVSSTSGLSATSNVSVTVNPSTDTVTITSAVYTTNKASLQVNVTDNTPGVTLTCTLNTTNPATGKP